MQPFTHPRDPGLLGQPVLPLFINARDFASCWHANAGFWEIRFFKHIPFPGANTSITSKSIRNIRRRNTIFHTLPNMKGQFVHTVPFHPVSCGDMVFTKLSRGNPHCHQGRVCQQWTAFTRQFPISSSSVTVIRTLVKSNWGEERGDFGSHFQLIIWLQPTAGSLRESVAIGSFSSPILLIWLFLSVIFVNGLSVSPIHEEPAPVPLFFVSFHFPFINFCSGLNGIFTSADLCLDCSFSGH